MQFYLLNVLNKVYIGHEWVLERELFIIMNNATPLASTVTRGTRVQHLWYSVMCRKLIIVHVKVKLR